MQAPPVARSTRQHNYQAPRQQLSPTNDHAAAADAKRHAADREDDTLSSVAASPRSMRTLEPAETLPLLLDDSLPPPAYSPRAPSNMYDSSYRGEQRFTPQSSSATYGTMSQADLLGSQRSQGMGETMIVHRDEPSNPRFPRKRRSGCYCCCCHCDSGRCIKLVLIGAGILLLMGFIIAWRAVGHQKGERDHNGSLPDSDPEMRLPWADCSEVPLPLFSLVERHAFKDPSSFTLRQGIPSGRQAASFPLKGKIHIAAAPSTQTQPLIVMTNVSSTSQDVPKAFTFAQSQGSLDIDATKAIFNIYPSNHCTTLNVLVLVSPHIADLSAFTVNTSHLSIEVASSLTLPTSDLLQLTTNAGAIFAPDYFSPPSRHIKISTVSGDIRGHFPLADELSLSTTSGSIAVDYTPKPNLPSNPSDTPAELTIRSVSGSIRASLVHPHNDLHPILSPATAGFPPRVYRTLVHSTSGGMAGSFLLGASAVLEDSSGGIDARVLPVAFPDLQAADEGWDTAGGLPSCQGRLRTTSSVGSIAVSVAAAPAEVFEAVLNATCSTHASVSGHVTLRVPGGWTGQIDAHSTTGGLLVAGSRMRVVERGRRWLKAERWGEDGEVGGSRMEVGDVSGGVHVLALD